MEDRLPSIEKFTDSNWPIWKLQITAYLQARELWKLCTGEETEPVLPAGGNEENGDGHAELISKYHVRVARVKSILLQMVSNTQLHVIAQQSLNTPEAMWDELVGTFERPTLSNKLQLQTRLLDLKMDSKSTIDSYFKELQDLTERLAALGAPVDNDFQVALLLRGLPQSYDGLRMAFVAKGTVSMSELREALKTEERRLYPDIGSVGASATSVLAARGGSRVRFKGRQKSRFNGPPGSCYGCGKMGHFHKNCPTNPYRHSVKKAEHEASNTDGNMSYEDSQDTILTIASASEIKAKDKSVWIIDSGATKHMSPRKEFFKKYVQFKVPETVLLGNGAVCDALGIGTVIVSRVCDEKRKQFTLSNVLYVPQLVNNFFSVTAATKMGCTVEFTGKHCKITRSNQELLMGYQVNQIWFLECETDQITEKVNVLQGQNTLKLWHERLGHVNITRLKTAVNQNVINGVENLAGYQKGTKGYRLYDEKNKRLVIRRDVVFKEVNFKGDEITVTPVDAEPSDVTKIGTDVHDPDLESDFQDDVPEAEINNSDADKRDDSATTTRSGRRNDPLTFVSLYVDDLVLITENSKTMDELKSMLMKHFVMKDMGPLHYILGIGCIQEESRIGLTQNAYIEKLVDKYGLTEAKPVSTPSDPNVVLQKDDGFSKP
eukprot:gene21173-23248_t